MPKTAQSPAPSKEMNIVNQHSVETLHRKKMKAIWRSADAVCFDVDSTVCVDEAIDELARYVGVGEKVKKMTSEAMGGGLTFKDSLTRRLGIIQPSIQNVQDFIENHPPRLTPGIREVVETLQERNVPVYLVSGGFHTIIERVAEELGIPTCNIFTNRLLFYCDGSYCTFDVNEPTCAEGGKTRVMEMLKKKHGYKRLVHIGDGMTDVETFPTVDAFIGFGGNIVRERVKELSSWYVYSSKELLDELERE